VKAHLKICAVAKKLGTSMIATLIAMPCSTKNKAGEREPGTHQT
jgi:hypothetical protein